MCIYSEAAVVRIGAKQGRCFAECPGNRTEREREGEEGLLTHTSASAVSFIAQVLFRSLSLISAVELGGELVCTRS